MYLKPREKHEGNAINQWLPLRYFCICRISCYSFVQMKVDNPMLLLERFVKGGGWFEIACMGFYGALVA